MKTAPLVKSRPTNRDIADNLNSVHTCLDDHRAETTRKLRAMDAKVGKLTTKLDTMAERLGADADPTHRTLATMPARKALLQQAAASGGAISSLFILWKLVWLIAPFAWGAVLAIKHFAVG